MLVLNLYAQVEERCATELHYLQLKQRGQILEDRTHFEEWLQNKINEKQRTQQFGIESEASQTIIIPVVVHVIHNGEAIGSGTNIPDAQIHSQISVLNKDFKRQNTDANETPAEFLPVAGSWDIEFVLAKRDPEGLATNGITRTRGSKSVWQFSDDTELKSMSYWPAEDYLNIWVADLAGNLTGYAQFPVSDLPGLETSSENRLTDGVVIDFRYFGSTDDGDFNVSNNFNKGRTGTHEVGHFFGLLHIWGLSTSCNSSDFVDDTPTQQSPTSGCPTHPRASCNSNDMFQNYMDYTVDRCMNIFSAGQVMRMQTILENSPRRNSLINSQGAELPVISDLDLGIRQIVSPGSSACPGQVIPQIELRNYGNQFINSARIELMVNDILLETLNLTLNLSNLETSTVSFQAVNINSNVSTSFQFEITEVNNISDENPANNTASIIVKTPAIAELPLFENFDQIPDNWQIINPDNKITWQATNAPKALPNNRAAFIDFYTNENKGERDYLLTPVFDFSQINLAFLSFDMAYARFPNVNADSLLVVVSTGCNFKFGNPSKNYIFRTGGQAMQTTVSTTSASFVPTGEDQWRRININMADFIGEQQVQIAFVGVNGYGNNLYLDNVSIIISEEEDIALERIISPNFVSCNQSPELRVNIQNTGTIPINSFKASVNINNNEQIFNFTNVELQALEEREFVITLLNLANGIYNLEVELLEPNDRTDSNQSNNKLNSSFAINTDVEISPLRLNFNNGIPDSWISLSPEQANTWQATLPNNHLFFNGWDNPSPHTTAWFVSPRINFSETEKASLFFDVSYGLTASKGTETLQVWASEDCGLTYTRLVYQKSGNA
ncbi:MAG TPA: M43 family zinc metalloprotease, partial [Cyclobacteriaceae bacterium]|nr:M43 family zinc metalloprotease [Cyclobacteriaceae bacterium]